MIGGSAFLPNDWVGIQHILFCMFPFAILVQRGISRDTEGRVLK